MLLPPCEVIWKQTAFLIDFGVRYLLAIFYPSCLLSFFYSSVSLSDLLTPYTDYFFQIFAVNIAGPSEASETTGMITTKMAPPEGPPRNVSIRAQNYSTLILNWEVNMNKWEYRISKLSPCITLQVQRKREHFFSIPLSYEIPITSFFLKNHQIPRISITLFFYHSFHSLILIFVAPRAVRV